MPWANLDDAFPNHPKNVPLSDAAFRLHVSGVCHAARYLTDGRIQEETVPLLTPKFRKTALAELLSRGHWHKPGEGCGTTDCPSGDPDTYVIHDFLEWNRSRATVESERERKSKGGKRGAEKRWHK